MADCTFHGIPRARLEKPIKARSLEPSDKHKKKKITNTDRSEMQET